jgi:DNA-binding response OmpR family regulator
MQVLIVEDETLIALGYQAMIADAGHDVFGIAASVAQARKLLAAGTPDAAVLDIRLGRELSYPVAAVLKDRGVPYGGA